MSKTRSAIVFLASALLAMPAAAQQVAAPLVIDGEQLVLSALGQDLVLPLPKWGELDDAAPQDLLGLVSVYFREEAGQARLEIYPRGESEALWTRLYGARLFDQPGLALANLRSVIVDVYARACRADSVALFQLEADNGDAIPPLGFVCGAYRDLPGYAGQGEVMVMGFSKSDKGVAMVYEEWRGKAFDPADSATWPVSTEQIEARIAQFKAEASLTPVD